jgi:hypothetical protein
MRRCFSMFLLLAAIWPQIVTAQKRAIPDDNLAYPVLINLTDCSSNIATIKVSGFFLDIRALALPRKFSAKFAFRSRR